MVVASYLSFCTAINPMYTLVYFGENWLSRVSLNGINENLRITVYGKIGLNLMLNKCTSKTKSRGIQVDGSILKGKKINKFSSSCKNSTIESFLKDVPIPHEVRLLVQNLNMIPSFSLASKQAKVNATIVFV